MKGDQESASCSPKSCAKKTPSLNEGLLMVPNAVTCLLKTALVKHKRTGSTGTTGDESYTTDDEDIDVDEPDISHGKNISRKLFNDHGDLGAFSSFTDISTITDKVRHLGVMHRNSSDSSVYSEKCSDTDFETKENDSDSKSGSSNGDQVDWAVAQSDIGEQAYLRLQLQLKEANQELELRDQELHRLNRIRQDVETELEELTASLFQVSSNFEALFRYCQNNLTSFKNNPVADFTISIQFY